MIRSVENIIVPLLIISIINECIITSFGRLNLTKNGAEQSCVTSNSVVHKHCC